MLVEVLFLLKLLIDSKICSMIFFGKYLEIATDFENVPASFVRWITINLASR
jgi:hypothetical protein